MEFNSKQVKITPDEAEAVIISMEIKSALEVYGNRTNDPEGKVLVITWENDKEKLCGEESVGYYEKELLTDNTKLGKMILSYKEIKVGSLIKVKKNASGYYKIITT